MKHYIYIILLALVSLGPLKGQVRPEYVGKGNWFFGVTGGAAWSLAENSHDSYSIWMPATNVQIGRSVSKDLSFRLSFGTAPQYGAPSKISLEYFPEIYRLYKFNVAQGFGEVMFNILNHNRKYREEELFDLYFAVGAGGVYSFDFSEFVEEWDPKIYPVSTEECFYPAGRLSMIAAHHIGKAWDLQYEFSIVGTDNKYNGVKGNAKGFSLINVYATAGLSLVYYFKDHSTGKHRFSNPPKIILDPYIPFEPTHTYMVGDTLETCIKFQLERDELSLTQHNLLREIAQYMKDNPQYNFYIVGYPDSRVGALETRLRLARQRAECVQRMLVKKLGIDASRLEVVDNPREHYSTQPMQWNSCGVFFVVK